MSTRNSAFTIHPALGGLDISSDPTVLDPNFLSVSYNVEYLEAGQRAKRIGSIQYAPTTSYAGGIATSSPGPLMVSSSSNVRAIADSWNYGATLTPVQRLVAVTGASIFRSTGDGRWTAVTTASSFGSNANTKANIVFGVGVSTSGGQADIAVISDGSAAPIAYNLGTTTLFVPTTGATWPIFESAVNHLDRMWYCGISTAPSDLKYTAADNFCDSTGIDAGTLTIQRGDNDRLIGISKPFYGSLYAFKGPNRGSVHQISGATPTTFTRTQIVHGAPALDHHGIISTPTDIYWISNYGVHSLQTTVKYGNVEQAFLSTPIQTLWRNSILSKSDLANAQGFWNPLRNIVGWLVTPASASGTETRTWLIVYNYGLSDPTPGGKKYWSIWQLAFGGVSFALINDPMTSPAGTEPHLFMGSERGLVYRFVPGYLSDDTTPYTMQITTPIITRFQSGNGIIPETQEKSFVGVVTYYDPSNVADITLEVDVDGGTEIKSFAVGAGGALFDSAIWDVDRFGSAGFGYDEQIIDGRGRSIALTWTSSGTDQNFIHFGYSIRYVPGEAESKEVVFN